MFNKFLFFNCERTQKINGFTLAEMMVVMLIMTIVLAMAAPLMTKKRMTDLSNSSPWDWVKNSNTEAYLLGGNDSVAMIGQTSKTDNDVEKNSHFIVKIKDKFSPFTIKKGSINPAYINIAFDNGGLTGTDEKNFRFGGPYTSAPSGAGNTAFGIGALSGLTSGGSNVAVGYNALYSNMIGGSNTAIGSNAMYENKSGGSNVAIGYDALKENIKGNSNVAVGRSALSANTEGGYNIAVGQEALKANETGGYNIGIGYNALRKNETGNYNISLGASALESVTSGEHNIGIGYRALQSIVGSSSSTSTQTVIDHDYDLISTTIMDLPQCNWPGHEYWSGTAYSYEISQMLNECENSQNCCEAVNYEVVAESTRTKQVTSTTSQKGGNFNTAIGYGACKNVKSSYKTCIGYNSGPTSADDANDSNKVIYLGDNDTTVYIPGDLVVGRTTVLGSREIKGKAGAINRSAVFAYLRRWGKNNDSNYSWVDLEEDGGNDNLNGPANGKPSTLIDKVSSDKRLKNISGESKAGLDKIRELKVFNYTFKKDEEKIPHVGVIAQDLQKVFPDAVTKGDDGYLMIRMEDMFYSSINAIKELDNFVQGIINEIKVVYEKITGIDKRVQALEKENKQLKEANKHLEKQIADINKRLKKLEK